MTLLGSPVCPKCGAPFAPGARFCVHCGASASALDTDTDEIALTGGQRVHLSAGALSLRELLAVVESGVFYWRQRLERADGVAREQAAAAIKDLSQILDNLAAQIAQGHETIRITGRLPPRRRAPRPCSLCGRGNRQTARYCMACGAPLLPDRRAEPRPLPPRRLAIAARTDRGTARPVNEDTVYAGEFTAGARRIGTLLVVADGMGGQQAGDVASSLAVSILKQALTDALNAGIPEDDQAWHALLRGAVQEANRQVYAHAQTDAGRRGMGTTLTVAVVTETRAHLAHVGDSRAYLLNPAGVTGEGSTWTQLTIDHTLVARLVDIGQLTPEEARVHPRRHMLYRSLGADPVTEVDALSQALAAGDVLVLCSDGLVNYVADGELAQIVLETPGEDQACERLITLANQRGGQDNISVVIARVKHAS
ncbi:MAG: Stp1/IreP family PP2C-type Ser/Thr phosphatase [Oscillochloridaceae bacterium]|nr:Stp1/IreP family PP2C-type Ser/Thr phosphatase [Chloroflexaceae bacterium]MDW8388768.1 Stp1/IreP family PP2C-type Ser/Thr phosphatase [Oscillochloridaceae bacterium]